MKIPQFTGSDFKIMFGILIPYAIILNSILYGSRLFSSPYIFILLLFTTLFIKIIFWQFHTWVAVALRIKFPADAQIMKRIGIALLCFYIMTGIANSTITFLYAKSNFIGFKFNLGNYLWVLVSGMILNTFTTLFHEGVSNLEKWKMTLTDTEQLKTEYVKSRLEGLKSQIKPHFLFNSINTLSALIMENPKEAELFLDEMCKVYRYLLRNHGAFISLEHELEFIHSYFYILKSRYGEGLLIDLNVSHEDFEKKLPPFTLQLLMENALQNNIISKQRPLRITLNSTPEGGISLTNNISSKYNPSLDSDETAIHNIINKFRLLGLEDVRVDISQEKRSVQIPLVADKDTTIDYEHI